MNILYAMLGGFALDWLFGDPAWLTHPVVIMGKAISALERALRARLPKTPRGERLGGLTLAIVLPVGTLLLTGGACRALGAVHPLLGFAVELLWCAQALAATGLAQESTNVYRQLEKDDLPAARKAVSRIVGRDTEKLTREGVTKAAVETVAENASDGVIAPLFYMMLGGAPLALTYKAVNTMDSMVGYKNEKYLNFGRAAAKLDDAVNYLPSRIAALLWIAAAALETVDCEIHRHMLREENDFALTDDVLNAIEPPIDRVFLCQPNNPTGQAANRTLMRRILAKCEAVGARLAVDECFLDFLPDGEAWTMKPELAAHPGLFILKAFTKLYGMAGVRLGYGLCADEDLLARMRRAGQPWAVSSLAQTAGLAALGQTKYVAQVRTLIETERPYLLEGLRALGLRVIEGRVNYLLFRADETLGERLEKLGVVVRSCGNYPGLDDSWYRTAVRTRRENDALLAALREAMA